MDERKYEDALKRAKELLDNMDKGDYFASKADIENIFPELKEKESEDEKTRKELIEHIKANKEADYVLFKKFSPDDVIAWLEKQGEKTHAKLGQSEVTKTSDQELSNKIEPKKGGEK